MHAQNWLGTDDLGRMVQVTVSIAGAIIAESTLAFLGLGVPPPIPSWGSILRVAQEFLSQAP